MNDFEFLALIVVIPLGLALVEIAQGLAASLKSRDRQLGTLTPLLALLIMQNLVVIFRNMFANQELYEISLLTILVALSLSTMFYLAASFTFPEHPEDHGNLDAWFMTQRKKSVGLVVFITLASDVLLFSDEQPSWEGLIVASLFFAAPLIFAIFVKTVSRARIAMIIGNLPFLLVSLVMPA